MTSPRRVLSPALHLVTALATALTFVLLTAPSATAEKDCKWVRSDDGESVDYVCTQTGEEGDPGEEGGPGGPQEPSCDLIPPGTFCMGETPCYYKDNVVPYAPPKSKPPKKDAEWRVRLCMQGGFWTGEAVWMDENEPEPPSLQEQAQTAFGQLRPTAADLSINPTNRTLVSLDTWFWADGLTAQALTGSSAFGLVAIATPDHLEVDPGDGSGTITCDWVTSESDACSYAYPRSSQAHGTTTVDGRGAYGASGQAVWNVAFELNGNPVNIPGAPTELRGPQMNTGVRVDEVQSLVRTVR